MKIVIDIPEEAYDYIQQYNTMAFLHRTFIKDAIKNGEIYKTENYNHLINTEILKAKQNITVGKEDYNMGIYVGLIKALNIFEDKALEQTELEPCDDCISRTEALKETKALLRGNYDAEYIAEMLKTLPPVTPKAESYKEGDNNDKQP